MRWEILVSTNSSSDPGPDIVYHSCKRTAVVFDQEQPDRETHRTTLTLWRTHSMYVLFLRLVGHHDNNTICVIHTTTFVQSIPGVHIKSVIKIEPKPNFFSTVKCAWVGGQDEKALQNQFRTTPRKPQDRPDQPHKPHTGVLSLGWQLPGIIMSKKDSGPWL